MITSTRSLMVRDIESAAVMRVSAIDAIRRLLAAEGDNNRVNSVVIHASILDNEGYSQPTVMSFHSDEIAAAKNSDMFKEFLSLMEINKLPTIEDFRSISNRTVESVNYIGVTQLYYLKPTLGRDEMWQATMRFPDDSMLKFSYTAELGVHKILSTHSLNPHMRYGTISYVLSESEARRSLNLLNTGELTAQQSLTVSRAITIRNDNNYSAILVEKAFIGESLDSNRPDWFL